MVVPAANKNGGLIDMNRRFFWQVPEYIKFRIVFETDETILGATDDNEYRLFRKDTNQIVFSICEALDVCFASLMTQESESLTRIEAGVA
jgi:hypothetical protein